MRMQLAAKLARTFLSMVSASYLSFYNYFEKQVFWKLPTFIAIFGAFKWSAIVARMSLLTCKFSTKRNHLNLKVWIRRLMVPFTEYMFSNYFFRFLIDVKRQIYKCLFFREDFFDGVIFSFLERQILLFLSFVKIYSFYICMFCQIYSVFIFPCLVKHIPFAFACFGEPIATGSVDRVLCFCTAPLLVSRPEMTSAWNYTRRRTCQICIFSI